MTWTGKKKSWPVLVPLHTGLEAVHACVPRGLEARRLQDGFPEWQLAGLPVERDTLISANVRDSGRLRSLTKAGASDTCTTPWKRLTGVCDITNDPGGEASGIDPFARSCAASGCAAARR